MTTRLQRLRNTTFLREVAGVRLVGSGIPEASAPTVAVGGTLQLSPRMTDNSGWDAMKYHTAPTFAYASADNAKATVNATTGLVTAAYTGSVDSSVAMTVTATLSDARTLTDSVTVVIAGDVTPASVDVSPATATKAPSATQQLTTVVKNAAGSTIAGELVTYSSSSAHATVNASGLITAVSTGSATITATSVTNPALTDTCVVTVS